MRVIVFKHIKRDGKIEFWHLLTNLPDILYPLQVMFDLYIMKGRELRLISRAINLGYI